MKIQQLNIHSYGKIKDKEIKFGDNINIIFGKNESGKSTIMHYIQLINQNWFVIQLNMLLAIFIYLMKL